MVIIMQLSNLYLKQLEKVHLKAKYEIILANLHVILFLQQNKGQLLLRGTMASS